MLAFNRLSLANESWDSVTIRSPHYVRLEPGAQVTDFEFAGPTLVERFACLNRVRSEGYLGVSCFSYLADVSLGPYTHIGARCSIGGTGHPTNWLSVSAFQYEDSRRSWGFNLEKTYPKPDKPVTTIGADVWIGDNVVVIHGVEIGVGAIVGAGTVVTKSVPPYAIVVGNPASVVKYRFPDRTIRRLLASEWWKYPVTDLSGLNFPDVEACLQIFEQRESAP